MRAISFVRQLTGFFIIVLILSCNSLKAESFKGGRDIAMVSAGVINLSLLVMVIHQASKKNKKSSIKKPIPLKTNVESNTKNTP